MLFYSLFAHIPLWGIFLFTIGLTWLAFEIGFRLGLYKKRRSPNLKEAPLNSAVAATLGLFAFILAFTFNMAANRFDERRNLVLEESNAIGTTYLRTGYLPEPQAEKIRQLLREYVSIRLEAVLSGSSLAGIETSEHLQDAMWDQAEQIARDSPDSIIAGLFIQSLNEVIDIHSKRVMKGLRSHIPEVIWDAIYCVAFLAMAAMGYQSGLSGQHLITLHSTLILTFSIVMALIGDLDRPQEGLLRVSQQSMIDLYKKIKREKAT
ncbi:hypothetical protein PNK_2358 [Candidatus Protochlamydia naegleriophila]|uniref:DUF4239 domain-containing protein n=1 Tax=Candidatus Protochlamydia naegleriophila TaxID=389348 RepID=A0A0U5JH73_9BACT|nr:DUF4239 domain-containing protein [Candidatus Protochlamydia naegleriophila]CUI17954.1 hypothetical protein PNK_2358 [Candidatus Protochlamydia naegleriophila]